MERIQDAIVEQIPVAEAAQVEKKKKTVRWGSVERHAVEQFRHHSRKKQVNSTLDRAQFLGRI